MKRSCSILRRHFIQPFYLKFPNSAWHIVGDLYLISLYIHVDMYIDVSICMYIYQMNEYK